MIVEHGENFSFQSVYDSSSVLSRCIMTRTCEIDGDDAQVLLMAFRLFMQHEASDPVPFAASRICQLIVTKTDSVTLTMEPHVYGCTAGVIFVNLARLRRIARLPNRIAVVLEELFHQYYLIQDEWDVKALVVRVLLAQFPGVTLHGLYPKMFDAQGKRLPFPSHREEPERS